MVYYGDQFYGTISFDQETEFGEVGVVLTQWITLFDDAEDDTYDGTLGEDDVEKPRVLLTFETVLPPQAQK